MYVRMYADLLFLLQAASIYALLFFMYFCTYLVHRINCCTSAPLAASYESEAYQNNFNTGGSDSLTSCPVRGRVGRASQAFEREAGRAALGVAGFYEGIGAVSCGSTFINDEIDVLYGLDATVAGQFLTQ